MSGSDNVTDLAAVLAEKAKAAQEAAQDAAASGWRPITVGSGDTEWTIKSPDEALTFVRNRLDHEGFSGVVQHGTHDPVCYSMVFDGEAIPVGDDLARFGSVQKALDARGLDIPHRSPKGWDPVRRCLVRLAVADHEDVAAEEALEWLQRYVGEREIEDSFHAVERREPFRHEDGRLYVRVNAMAGFVRRSMGENLTADELRRRLLRLGFDKAPFAGGQVSVREGDRVVKARYLASRPGFDPAA